jgi:hypothetical protein
MIIRMIYLPLTHGLRISGQWPVPGREYDLNRYQGEEGCARWIVCRMAEKHGHTKEKRSEMNIRDIHQIF